MLRTATRRAHDVLDASFAGDRLEDREAYGDFLTMQLRARLPLERWAAHHCPPTLRPPETTPEILQDLLALGRPISLRHSELVMPANADPRGLAWAIAGSHLGNRAMLHGLRKADVQFPASFLADLRMAVFWKDLQPTLESRVSDTEAQRCVDAALAVFRCFEAALPPAPEKIAA